MDKESFKDKVKECEDAIITYRSTNSRKLKYNVCTLNFTTPYIQKKHNRAKETKDTVLLFCWDTEGCPKKSIPFSINVGEIKF